MTDTTTVTIEGILPDGTAAVNQRVTASLIHGGAGASVDGEAVVIASKTVKLDADGGSVDLIPNSLIEPAGTFYALVVDNSSPTVTRCIEVPEGGPVSWADPGIQVEAPVPPVSVPAASSGDPLQVLRVKADGSGFELADLTGGDGDTAVRIGALIEDVDLAGGDFTTFTLHSTPGAIPREFGAGSTVVTVTGSDIGHVWTLTASGPCTQGAALSPGDRIVSFEGITAEAVGSGSVQGIVVQATEAYAQARATAAQTAAAALVTAEASARTTADTALSASISTEAGARTSADAALQSQIDGDAHAAEDAYAASLPAAAVFELCTDFGDTYNDHVWSSATLPTVSTGIWIRSKSTIRPYGDTSLDDGDEVYSEIASETMDGGIGAWDRIEKAVRRVWRDADARFDSYLFYEATPIGGTTDSYKLIDESWKIPEGVPIETAVWVQFNAGGQSVGRLLRRAYITEPDFVLDGAGWKVVYELTGAPTSLHAGNGEALMIGSDLGRLETEFVQIRTGSPSGTLVASPDAADGVTEGGDQPFTDGTGRTWTPTGSEAVATAPDEYATAEDIAAAAVEVVTHAASSKATPVDADEIPLVDSAASNGLKKLTWANMKATLKTYFDTLYMAVVAGSDDDFMQRKSGAWTNRTLAQVRTDLGGLQLISRKTLSSSSSLESFTIPSGIRHGRLTIGGFNTSGAGATLGLRHRFNGDTSSAYSTNAVALTTYSEAARLSGSLTNTDRSSFVVYEWWYVPGKWLTGYAVSVQVGSNTSTSATPSSSGFSWTGATSTAPTSIDLYFGTGDFASGCEFSFEGAP